MILTANPLAQYRGRKAEIDQAIQEVLDSGQYILGPQTSEFEVEFASYVGVRFAVGVGSGTEALHLALRACGLGPGDEVITVSHTAVATVAAIELSGATPILADIDPGPYTLNPERLQNLITPRTKAVVPVHLYGQPAPMEPILEFARIEGLKVIEDCAQAHGAIYRGRRVGSLGDIACFSFYPTKNLGAIGDGGIVVTDDPTLAEKARQMREFGWDRRHVSGIVGWNTRLDELQAAVLRVKLRYLDSDNAARARWATLYTQLLAPADIVLPLEQPDTEHVYHQYVIRSDRRDELQSFLKEDGIGTLVHYPVPVHLQLAYRGRLRGQDDLAESELAARQVLSLPVYPELQESDVRTVAESILEFGK